MNAMQQGIVTLLKSAITGEKLALPEEFDIDEALPRIKAHHMASLVYAGAVNCGVDQKKPAMQQLFQSYCKALQVSERQMRELGRVFAAFDETGIDYLPLKGCIMKAMYPRPELRMMGDADVLIRVEQYERIAPIMRKLGFAEGEESEQDFVWKSDSLYLELHKYPIAPQYEEYYAYFKDGWPLAHVQSGTRYAMNVENTLIFLFTHFAKHFSAAGVGCRHVVDLWVYLRNHPEMNESYLCTEMTKLKLWKFYRNVRRLIAVWFEGEGTDDRAEIIAQVIFSNGSWGFLGNATLSKGAQDMGKSGSAVISRIKYVWYRLFPHITYLQTRYPILRRQAWLLPVMWFAHLIEKLVSIRSIWRKHSRQMRLLNQDKLESRRKMLEYIGLDGNEK